jgi:RNA polymerase sigma factor (sigma-70 family)
VSSSHKSLETAFEALRQNPAKEDSWAAFFRAAWPWIFSHAYRDLRGIQDLAEDVSQDVCLRLLRTPSFPATVEDAEHCKHYLRRVTRNACIDLWRKEQRESRTVEGVRTEPSIVRTVGHSDDPAEELSPWLLAAITRLNEGDRRLVEFLVTDRPLPSIAVELGVSYSAAAVRMHRIRARLRKLLTPNDLTPGVQPQ